MNITTNLKKTLLICLILIFSSVIATPIAADEYEVDDPNELQESFYNYESNNNDNDDPFPIPILTMLGNTNTTLDFIDLYNNNYTYNINRYTNSYSSITIRNGIISWAALEDPTFTHFAWTAPVLAIPLDPDDIGNLSLTFVARDGLTAGGGYGSTYVCRYSLYYQGKDNYSTIQEYCSDTTSPGGNLTKDGSNFTLSSSLITNLLNNQGDLTKTNYLVIWRQRQSDYNATGTGSFSTTCTYDITYNGMSNQNKIKLNKPTLTLNGNILSWNTINNADYYLVVLKTGDRTYSNSTNNTSWTCSLVGDYYVWAIPSSDSNYQSSDYSNSIYFNGSNLSNLGTPVITKNYNVLTWTQIPNAYAYRIYRNQELYDRVTTNSYTCDTSGVYSVQAIPTSASTTYTDGPISASVQVTIYNNDPSTITKPIIPTEDTLLDWFVYYTDLFEYYVTYILTGITNIIASVIESINTIVQYTNTLVSSLGGLFAFLPYELRSIIIACISLMITITFIKFFRGL